MTADGEKPLHDMPVNLRPRLDHELDEGILHDISRPVGIAEQAGGIADKRGLMLPHGGLHPGVLVMVGVLRCGGCGFHVTSGVRRAVGRFLRPFRAF